MSYDIYLRDPVDKSILEFKDVHHIRGGTFAIGGTTQAHLNITYNYSGIFRQYLGESGIREIYGKSGAESIPILLGVIEKLGDDTDPDYWKATEGNAKKALCGLLALARMRPDGVWHGD